MMRAGLVAVVVMSLATPWVRAEEVEHPAYRSWAAHPPGTTVVIRSRTSSPNSTITTTTTSRLVRLDPEAAILETRKTSDATGQVVEGLPDRLEQRRWFPLFAGVKKEEVGKPRGALAQGEETLRIADREIRTTWFDVKDRGDAGETLTRTWMSDEVPGRLVKAVTQIPKARTTVTLELIQFDRP